jgi:phosphoribosyl 1,2-cyclic phosphodiesterase
MLSITVLGSGSAGNCAVVATERCKLLVDAGLSARQILKRLEVARVAPEELDGILITHEHGDHICGLEVFCRRFDLPIFANAQTAAAMKLINCAGHRNWRLFATGSEFSIKDITIQSFPVPHDAVEPVGFVLHHNGASLGFCTDLGFATKLVLERLRQVSTLLIETNHDEKMLQDDVRRPWPVKQRILSRHGHLSNDAAAVVVAELAGQNLRRAVLGHLSRDCNQPALAIGAVRSRLGEAGAMEIVCASQTEPGVTMVVGAQAA